MENISKSVFRNHSELITELIRKSPGVYALYDDMGLYYVGRSKDLKGRVFTHLKDRHKALWSHFSLYFLRNERYVDEMESLLIRIANPKGNRVKPKGGSTSSLLKQLKAMVRQKQNEEFSEMFDLKSKSHKKRIKQKKSSLQGLVKKNTKLFRTYKGKEYTAILRPSGKIRFNNKTFESPSSAGQSIVKHGCNGWRFWYLKDNSGNVISLDELR